ATGQERRDSPADRVRPCGLLGRLEQLPPDIQLTSRVVPDPDAAIDLVAEQPRAGLYIRLTNVGNFADCYLGSKLRERIGIEGDRELSGHGFQLDLSEHLEQVVPPRIQGEHEPAGSRFYSHERPVEALGTQERFKNHRTDAKLRVPGDWKGEVL